MHGTTKEEILKDFEEFKDYLSKQVNRGKKLGLDDGKLVKSAAILETTSRSMKSRTTVKKCCCKNFGALRTKMRKNIWHSCWSNWLISNKNTSRAHMLPGFLDIVTARLFQICYTTIMSVKGAFICMWFIIFGIIFFIEGIIMTVYGVKKKTGCSHISALFSAL